MWICVRLDMRGVDKILGKSGAKVDDSTVRSNLRIGVYLFQRRSSRKHLAARSITCW